MKKMNLSLSSIEPLIQKISELTRMQRIIICVASIVVIVGLFVWLLYMPQIKEIKRLNDEIAKQEEKLKTTKATAAQYPIYKKKWKRPRPSLMWWQERFRLPMRFLPC